MISTRRWLAFSASWGPVVLWAAVIFSFSTESFSSPETSRILGPALNWFFPSMSAHQFEVIHLTIRKLGHWSEYFIFAILVHRALRYRPGSYSKLLHNAFTAIIIFVYAISDELHQAFVPSRTASVADVLLDSFGGVCALLWLSLWRK